MKLFLLSFFALGWLSLLITPTCGQGQGQCLIFNNTMCEPFVKSKSSASFFFYRFILLSCSSLTQYRNRRDSGVVRQHLHHFGRYNQRARYEHAVHFFVWYSWPMQILHLSNLLPLLPARMRFSEQLGRLCNISTLPHWVLSRHLHHIW